MWPIYQGRTCFPRNDTTSADKCTIGGYPTYAVNVSSVAQVQLALNFARNNNIRVVIKNTGHCYLGKSSGAGSLSIWMHNIKQIEYLPKYETNDYSGPAMKAGAGVTVQEVYKAAEARGGTIQGGICEVEAPGVRNTRELLTLGNRASVSWAATSKAEVTTLCQDTMAWLLIRSWPIK